MVSRLSERGVPFKVMVVVCPPKFLPSFSARSPRKKMVMIGLGSRGRQFFLHSVPTEKEELGERGQSQWSSRVAVSK